MRIQCYQNPHRLNKRVRFHDWESSGVSSHHPILWRRRSYLIAWRMTRWQIFRWMSKVYSVIRRVTMQYIRPLQQQKYSKKNTLPIPQEDEAEELDQYLCIGLISPVKQATWLSPLVIVLKKNSKLWTWMNHLKLNAATVATVCDPFTVLRKHLSAHL